MALDIVSGAPKRFRAVAEVAKPLIAGSAEQGSDAFSTRLVPCTACVIMVDLETSTGDPGFTARVCRSAQGALPVLGGKHFLIPFQGDAMLVPHVALPVERRIGRVVASIPRVPSGAPVVLAVRLCAGLAGLFACLDVPLIAGMRP